MRHQQPENSEAIKSTVKEILLLSYQLGLEVGCSTQPFLFEVIKSANESESIDDSSPIESDFFSWKVLADAGYPWAQNHVGRMFDIGYGCEKNTPLAHYYYDLADIRLSELYEDRSIARICIDNVEPNRFDIMEVLARVYELGLFGECKNVERSTEWYAKADRALYAAR